MKWVAPEFSSKSVATGEALSGLVHRLRHDVDNPVTSIISIAGVLQQMSRSSQDLGGEARKIADYANHLTSEAWRISGLLEKFTAVVSERLFDEERAALSTIVRKEVSTLLDEFGPERLEFSNSDKDFEVRLTERDCKFLIKELLLNAFLHSPTQDTVIQVSLTEAEDVVSFEVSNPCDESKISPLVECFKPFSTCSSAPEHVGLGLTAVWGIVERAEGTVEIGVDGGKFHARMKLPHTSKKEKETAPARSPKKKASLSELGVLIIDDETTVSSAIKKILQVAFSGVDSFHCLCLDGTQVIDSVLSQASYNVILCDINLKHVSGKRIFQQIQQNHPELIPHFAFITADTSQAVTREFLKRSGRPFLLKPFEADALIGLVRKLAHGDS